MATIGYYSILLDGDKMVFTPGENVEGRIVFKLNKGMRIKSIVVSCRGEGRVDYCRYVFGEIHYINREEYFSESRLLYDVDQDQHRKGKFSPGEYSFPFSFKLSCGGLPTSFQGEYGRIRYWLESAIKRPWWSEDDMVKFVITVIEPVDIDQPDLRRPKQNHSTHRLKSCVSAVGKLNILGEIEKGAYYPGEELAAKMYVENMSSRDVTYTEVVLEQVTKYQYSNGSGNCKEHRVTMARGIGPGVPRYKEDGIEHLRLTIPAVQPTTTSSTIISISYCIKLSAHVKGPCVVASSIIIPIKIGRTSSGIAQGLNTEIVSLLIQSINRSDVRRAGVRTPDVRPPVVPKADVRELDVRAPDVYESDIEEQRETDEDIAIDCDDRQAICPT